MSDSVRASYRAVLSQIREPLIIDLRGCGGGDPELAYFILCHLFADGEPLFELHTRTRAPQLFKAASTLPFYLTANTVTKYKGAISVVVNGHTASAAELIASVIKNRGRGKIYGSRTAATAHIYMSVQLDGLIVNLPVAKTVDPESKKSWEGVGVTPDYEVGSKEYIDLIYRNMSAEVFSPGRVGPTNPFKITIDVDKYR